MDVMVNYDETVHNSLGDILQFIYGRVHRWSEVRWCLTHYSLGHLQQSLEMVQNICCEIIYGLVKILINIIIGYNGTVYNSLGDVLQFIYYKVHKWSKVR